MLRFAVAAYSANDGKSMPKMLIVPWSFTGSGM
jgi:hypothetical protein